MNCELKVLCKLKDTNSVQMKKLFLLWINIFFSFSIQAQSILKIENISHIVLDEDNLSLIQSSNGVYQYINVDLKGIDDIQNPIWKSWNEMQKYIGNHNTIIPINEISVFKNYKRFSDFIMNSKFEYNSTEGFIKFSPVSNYFFAIETQGKNKINEIDSVLFRILELNREHYLILLSSGYIIFDQNYNVKFFKHYDSFDNVEFKKFDKTNSKDLLNKILVRNPIDYNRIFSKSGKDSIIYNYSFNEKVELGNFDSVYIMNPFFIVEKENKTFVYDFEGKLLFRKKFRNWQVNQNTGQLITLEKNSIIYYDFDGSKSKERIPLPMSICGILDGKSYRIDSTNNHVVILNNNNFQEIIHLRNLPENSTVRFINNELWAPTNIYDLSNPIDEFDFIVSKNNKSGLFKAIDGKYSFEFNEDSFTEMVEVLPVEYDKIELFQGKLLLYQNGLIAIYPYSKTPNYLSIGEYKSGYYRIISKNGQKGWLEWNSGKEFWDQ